MTTDFLAAWSKVFLLLFQNNTASPTSKTSEATMDPAIIPDLADGAACGPGPTVVVLFAAAVCAAVDNAVVEVWSTYAVAEVGTGVVVD